MSEPGLRFPNSTKPDPFRAPLRGSSVQVSSATVSRAQRLRAHLGLTTNASGLSRAVGRRSFLSSILRGGIGFGMAYSLAPTFVVVSGAGSAPRGHLAWVWQFTEDGEPERVRSVLAANRLGIVLKTHDGTDWMGEFDDSEIPITGPGQISRLARFFEAGGVPFHAWCVVKGLEPEREAAMAAEAVNAGARSLFLDLEPSDGGHFWEGTPESALAFGRLFRRLQPGAWLSVAPDPRPWQVEAVPVAEFATFSNEFAPQAYWDQFDNDATKDLLLERGIVAGFEGVTPELTLDLSQASLAPFGLPIRPIGEGASSMSSWRRFVAGARNLGMGSVSVWRYGTSNPGVWRLLRETPPQAGSLPRV